MGHTGEAKTHFYSTERSRQHEVVEMTEVPYAKNLARKLPETGPKGHVEVFEDGAAQSVRVVTLGHKDRSHRARIFPSIFANDLEAPGSYRRARRFRVTIMPAKYVWQPLLFEHQESFSQAIEKGGRGRIGKESVTIGSQDLFPVPIRTGQPRTFSGRESLFRNGVEA
jgi:hypothetical protein